MKKKVVARDVDDVYMIARELVARDIDDVYIMARELVARELVRFFLSICD